MKTRSLFLWAIIAALWGMVTACEDLDPLQDRQKDTEKKIEYTVSFEANGGSPAPQSKTIQEDEKIPEPAYMSKNGYGFAGWYTEAAFINLWDFDHDTVTGNITLYAQWDSNYHTVTFVANGGNPAPLSQNIAHGYKAIRPQNISKGGFNFEGWYTEADFNHVWNFNSDTVTANIVLYAKWGDLIPSTTVSNVPGTTLAQKLEWIASNAASNTNYFLEVNSDEYLAPHNLFYNGKSNIYIQLTGIGGVKTIELYGLGSLFTIQYGVTLVLNENIILKTFVTARSGGNLIMNNGSKFTNGRVSVEQGGTFTMNGGEISGNNGGGVYVGYYGTFTMNGGKISGNNDRGVSVELGGTFTMTGGEISGNTATSGDLYGGELYGGGVYVDSGSFEKTGGIITGYSSDTVNGNVVKDSSGVLNNRGHAVYVNNSTNSLFIRRKETTAGQGDNLIYIRNGINPPTISGAWDE